MNQTKLEMIEAKILTLKARVELHHAVIHSYIRGLKRLQYSLAQCKKMLWLVQTPLEIRTTVCMFTFHSKNNQMGIHK